MWVLKTRILREACVGCRERETRGVVGVRERRSGGVGSKC